MVLLINWGPLKGAPLLGNHGPGDGGGFFANIYGPGGGVKPRPICSISAPAPYPPHRRGGMGLVAWARRGGEKVGGEANGVGGIKKTQRESSSFLAIISPFCSPQLLVSCLPPALHFLPRWGPPAFDGLRLFPLWWRRGNARPLFGGNRPPGENFWAKGRRPPGSLSSSRNGGFFRNFFFLPKEVSISGGGHLPAVKPGPPYLRKVFFAPPPVWVFTSALRPRLLGLGLLPAGRALPPFPPLRPPQKWEGGKGGFYPLAAPGAPA